MSSKSLLLTGASSFIGFHCLIKALEQGYTVHCVVRSESKLALIRSNALIKSLHPGDRLSFAIVSDFTDKQAWLSNLQGLDFVLHLATPKPRDHFDEDRQFVQTAVEMTTSLLKAAAEVSTIKRVVITSSLVAITPRDHSINDAISENTRMSSLPTPYPNAAVKYVASKIEALKAVDAFIDEQNPAFQVINIFPGWSIGRHELASSPQSLLQTSNYMVLLPLVGKPLPVTGRPAFPTVHVEDVADLHLRALGGEINNHCGLVAATSTHYDQIISIAQKHFPEAVESGKLQGIEVLPTPTYMVDNHPIGEVFDGFKFRDFEDQVVSAVGQYLELLR